MILQAIAANWRKIFFEYRIKENGNALKLKESGT